MSEVAVCMTSFCKSTGTGGLPLGRDFHGQNKRKPFRYQLSADEGVGLYDDGSVPPIEQPTQGHHVHLDTLV